MRGRVHDRTVRELPSGTVTFLFSDVEGSTRLLREHGERYAELLSEHRAVLRDAFARHGGVEVDTQGDAFFVAFARASDALAAAVEAQAELRESPISVRIGIHTGEPVVTSEGYVGMDIHRAARIAAAGHGGQVLLSQATHDLVATEDVRDLGDHRLKDLSAPERVFQLGGERFPPLKSLRQTNLPVPATPFLGRARELEEVVGLLRDENVRLLTLTGPGGTGKTRLALQAAAEVAEDAPDGVWWVSLAALRDPALALDAVANVLGVRERPGVALEETLADSLAAKRALLLIDNAEHLLPQVAAGIAWLRQAGGPKLLVTSRKRLQLQGEHSWTVPSLDEHDGPALFTARARALRPEFSETAATAELCNRLDNLPLALELAAARIPIFSPEQLLERLGRGLDLKGGRDADPRQQTLDATIRWSYDLLSSEEQQLFTQLAVFAGGCTYEAAEAVCAAEIDTLQSLIDKSLVRSREVAGRARFWMLETIREFAAEQLEAFGEAEALRLRHAEFFTELAEHADPYLRHGPDQQQWGALVAADYDNVRAAMNFALGHAPALAVRLLGRLQFFLWLRGGFAEARAWVDAVLPHVASQPPGLVGRMHECAAVIAERLGDVEGAVRHADEAYAAFASIEDEHGMANALRERGKAASAAGDTARAAAVYTELAELAERIGDRWNGAIALNNLGDVALQSGDWERVVELCGRSSILRRDLGDEWGTALALCNVAIAELQLGRLSSAAASLRVALETSVKVDAKMVIATSIDTSVLIAAALGNMREAALLAGASERMYEELGSIRDSFEGELFARTVDSIRAALGADAYANATQHGRELTLEEAAACALAATGDPD
jgi:predicted ATPase/class 3 adenylate cyclase